MGNSKVGGAWVGPLPGPRDEGEVHQVGLVWICSGAAVFRKVCDH